MTGLGITILGCYTVLVCVVPDISKDHSAFTSRPQSKKNEDLCTEQWSVISLKTWIFSNTTVRTSNLKELQMVKLRRYKWK